MFKTQGVKGFELLREKNYYLLKIMFMLDFSADLISFIYLLFYLLDIHTVATHYM